MTSYMQINNVEDVLAWTFEHCKSYLKSDKAISEGSKAQSYARCMLLKY